jgi:hypothetical protein
VVRDFVRSEQKANVSLIVYLVAGINDDMDRAHLRQAVAQARTFEDKAVSFNSRFVNPKEVGLPQVLS